MWQRRNGAPAGEARAPDDIGRRPERGEVNLSDVLAWQYPDADPSIDWRTEFDADSGREVIVFWNAGNLGDKPAQSLIDGWYMPAVRWYKRRELRRAHNAQFAGLFSLDGEFMQGEHDFVLRQEARGLRTAGDGTQVGTILQTMDQLRTRLTNRLDQANDQTKTTVAQVEAVTW